MAVSYTMNDQVHKIYRGSAECKCNKVLVSAATEATEGCVQGGTGIQGTGRASHTACRGARRQDGGGSKNRVLHEMSKQSRAGDGEARAATVARSPGVLLRGAVGPKQCLHAQLGGA